MALETSSPHCSHGGESLDGSQGLDAPSIPSVPRALEPEKTLWVGTPSHYYYLFPYAVGVLMALAYGAGLILIIWAILDRRSRVFTVTTRRVMSRSGIVAKSTQELAMAEVCSIDVQQGIIERILGLGTVQIGSTGTAVQFSGIPGALRVKEVILQCTSCSH